MDLKSELLAIFGGYKVLMAKDQREPLVGLEVSEPIGVGVCRSARFGLEIVCEYVENLADGVMSEDIRVSWIEIDPDLIAGRAGPRGGLGGVHRGHPPRR